MCAGISQDGSSICRRSDLALNNFRSLISFSRIGRGCVARAPDKGNRRASAPSSRRFAADLRAHTFAEIVEVSRATLEAARQARSMRRSALPGARDMIAAPPIARRARLAWRTVVSCEPARWSIASGACCGAGAVSGASLAPRAARRAWRDAPARRSEWLDPTSVTLP